MSSTAGVPLAVDDFHLGEEPLVVRAQDVEVDLGANLAWVGSQRLLMPAKELHLLFLLVANAGRVVRREILIERLWAGKRSNKNLDVHIRRLRQRIEPDPQRPRYIRTARGIGYIFDIFDE